MALARSAAALMLGALALGGCLTSHSRPQVSQAVLDARAHRNTPTAAACPQTPLASLSPLMVGFAFGASQLPDLQGNPLADTPRWLDCHPSTAVVVKPDADGLGTDAEQDALARRRADAVVAYLTGRGVAPARLQVLPRGGAEPAGEHLLVLAEGRRW
jgi:outer membrane protein OmpA-like peptidoglycan-associated protein